MALDQQGSKIEYNKLVRDKIPEIIEEQGKKCETRIMEKSEENHYLNAKLYEECMEFIRSGDPDELADVLDVIITIADKRFGKRFVDIESTMWEKRTLRGGFDKGIILESVEG